MPSALVVVFGSRGDTEPLIALTTTLLATGTLHHVHLCLQGHHRHLVPNDSRITPHELPINPAATNNIFYWQNLRDTIVAYFTRDYDPIRSQRKSIAEMIARGGVPMLPFLNTIAQQETPDIIITTTLAGPIGSTLAEPLAVPIVLVNLQPNSPTTRYPSYMSGMQHALAAAKEIVERREEVASLRDTEYVQDLDNISSYDSQDDLHLPSLATLNSFRNSINLPQWNMDNVRAILHGTQPGAHVINSYSTQLVPKAPDWSPRTHLVPPMADDYIPNGWNAEEACPNLAAYLADGSKPFCISFGSMNVDGHSASVSHELLHALRAYGLDRVVLLKGAADLGAHCLSSWDSELRTWAEEHVFMCDEQPQYAWLLPKCSAILCHGGAGTTFAALRAGLPVAVSPVLCDQFLWGEIVKRRGLGAVVEPRLKEAKSERFQAAFELLFSSQVRERVAAFREVELDRESGCALAAEIIASVLQ